MGYCNGTLADRRAEESLRTRAEPSETVHELWRSGQRIPLLRHALLQAVVAGGLDDSETLAVVVGANVVVEHLLDVGAREPAAFAVARLFAVEPA